MDIEAIRRYCLQFPHATENVQWEIDLCLKVDGKLFAVVPLEPARVRLSFKCNPEKFAELCERPGVIPAPYMARAQWVALQAQDVIPDSELRELLAESYRLVFERLPKKRQLELRSGRPAGKPARALAAKKRTPGSGSPGLKRSTGHRAGKKANKNLAGKKRRTKTGRAE
jgi:predicted DNA-binding protein (MmcQ/YjbR family)